MKTPQSDYRQLAGAVAQIFLPQIEEAYKTLPVRRQLILDEIYGINDGIKKTLQEVGDRMNLNKTRIHVIKEDALAKLISEFCKTVGKL